jgi:hypothetical protein
MKRRLAILLVAFLVPLTIVAVEAPAAHATVRWQLCYGDGVSSGCYPHAVASNRSPSWSVPAQTGSYRLVFQSDCNLVFYDPGYSNGVSWATGTHSTQPCTLKWQSDGNMVIYNYQGLAGWASGTNKGQGGYVMYMNDIGQLWIDHVWLSNVTHVWCNHPGACTWQ